MNGISFYKEEIRDCNAVYFTEEFFNAKNDGSIDVSNELQNAIKTVVDKAGYGVLFIPEGEYLLSKTIYVPKAVRLIGYGDNIPHFILKDNAEVEEQYYCYKYKELMQIGGHYVYYEKNAAMQSYMITARKKIGVTPSEVVEDKAAKDFRNLVKERFEAQEQKKTSRLTYVASVFLVIVVLIMGVTTLNNYGKMKSVQSSLEFIRNSIMKQGEEKTQKTSGTVKEANEQQNENTVQSEQTNDPQTEEQQDPMPQQGEGSDSASTEEEKVDDSSMSTMQEMSEDIYIVEKGETLAKISKKVYGDSGHVDAICRMNGLSDGNLIFIGQKLILP